LREWGLNVSERQIAIDDVMNGIENGTLQEIWGLGTAAVVSPIGELTYRDKTLVVGPVLPPPTTARLYEAITKLHTQAGNDPYGWRVDVT